MSLALFASLGWKLGLSYNLYHGLLSGWFSNHGFHNSNPVGLFSKSCKNRVNVALASPNLNALSTK
jgi:hypothetical protein